MKMEPVKLYYEEVGQGMPIVLVHGYPLDHSIWKETAERLARYARVILPDLRGYGKSPRTDGVYSMRLMADDLLMMLDSLGIDKVIMAGHSMGGYITLEFAHSHPDRLAGLGLIASQTAGDGMEKRQNRLATADKVHKKGIEVVAESMSKMLTGVGSMQQELLALIRACASREGVEGALRGMADRADSTERLASMSVPAVVIHGTQDAIIPLEKAQEAAQLLPWGWLVKLEGAGHMPMMEHPDATADALRELVQKSTK